MSQGIIYELRVGGPDDTAWPIASAPANEAHKLHGPIQRQVGEGVDPHDLCVYAVHPDGERRSLTIEEVGKLMEGLAFVEQVLQASLRFPWNPQVSLPTSAASAAAA